MPRRQDLLALRDMIAEVKTLLDTSAELPQGRTQRACELLGDAAILADYVLTVQPAAVLGANGGKGHRKARLRVLPKDCGHAAD